MSLLLPRASLSLALLLNLLPNQLHAEEPAPPDSGQDTEQSGSLPAVDRKQTTALSTVTVKGASSTRSSDALTAPASVLDGVALDEARAGTLGQTVANVPGVQASAFGQGAGRPVIRGIDGPRVAVLADGMGTGDVSSVSQDHGVSIEPFLADRIEILKGPATLLYGSGAIGGAVNVSDGRIPEQIPDSGLDGRVQTGYDSVSSGNTQAFRLDAGSGQLAFHADGLARNDHDYAIRGAMLANSHVQTRTGALGTSWIDTWGYAGISVSRYLDNYGNPAEPGDPANADPAVQLRMQQTRVDARGALDAPLPGIDRLEWNLARIDYRHTEFEGTVAGTVFSNRSSEARLVANTRPWADWRGAFGLQVQHRDFAALGEEAFVSPTVTDASGLFATARRDIGELTADVGARIDRVTSDPSEQARRRFQPTSLSAALTWRIDPAWHLTLNLDRAQRAPGEEELFAHGPHQASMSWEIGDSALRVETANQAEIGLHFHGALLDAKASLYTNRYADFIHLADTGDFNDGLPVRRWTQRDASFRGGEVEATWHLASNQSGHYDLRLWGDRVRATFTEGGGNVPRIPSARVGSELRWHDDDWRASLGVTRYFSHDDTAFDETPTAGFTMLSAHLAWAFFNTDRQSWELFADGNNLGNRIARLSTSLIKDEVPLPGRNLRVGVRGMF
ncbi:MAG: TonB-dependent receptor [Dokdonella sp.]|nr:TonB-dependent receptor [Dokdonella sp.]